MKNFKIFLLLFFVIFTANSVMARCHGHYHYHSTPVYLVRSDYYEDETKFQNCAQHGLLTKTIVNIYSNGTRRVLNYYTVINSNDGTVLLDGCTDVAHVMCGNEHYFLFKKDGKYQIAHSSGKILSVRKYSKMKEISENRILVKIDKKYGIIDLEERSIVPIKYKKFEQIGGNLFLTKLNGYYGMLDISNKLVLKNEYERIIPIYDTFLLKRYGKYGLANKNGKIIIKEENDSIKKLGEYILVKKDGLYKVYSAQGISIDNNEYKKIKLERNTLMGKLKGKGYVTILSQEL